MIPPGLMCVSAFLKQIGRTWVHSSLPSTTMTSNFSSGIAWRYSDFSKAVGFLKSNGCNFSVTFCTLFSFRRLETSPNHRELSSMDQTDLVRRAKKSVEPPEPYSHTLMWGRRNSSRKSIAAYENHGISRSSGVCPLITLCVRQRGIY